MIQASTFVTATLIHSVTHMCPYMEYELYVIALNEVINTSFCNKRIFTLCFIHCLVLRIHSLNYLAICYTCTTLTHLRTMPHRLVRYSQCTYIKEIEKIAKILVQIERTVATYSTLLLIILILHCIAFFCDCLLKLSAYLTQYKECNRTRVLSSHTHVVFMG